VALSAIGSWLLAVGALAAVACGGAASSEAACEGACPSPSSVEPDEPFCALEGDYHVQYLPEAGCGSSNEFPARIEFKEVECQTAEQRCEPGAPSARCEFTRRLGEACSVRVIWEREGATP
jgi:hypothetical protein